MKNPDFFGNFVPALVTQHHVQQQTAVLASGERNINVVEVVENKFKPVLQGFIDIFLQVFLHNAKASSLEIMRQTLERTFFFRLKFCLISLSSPVLIQRL